MEADVSYTFGLPVVEATHVEPTVDRATVHRRLAEAFAAGVSVDEPLADSLTRIIFDEQ